VTASTSLRNRLIGIMDFRSGDSTGRPKRASKIHRQRNRSAGHTAFTFGPSSARWKSKITVGSGQTGPSPPSEHFKPIHARSESQQVPERLKPRSQFHSCWLMPG